MKGINLFGSSESCRAFGTLEFEFLLLLNALLISRLESCDALLDLRQSSARIVQHLLDGRELLLRRFKRLPLRRDRLRHEVILVHRANPHADGRARL